VGVGFFIDELQRMRTVSGKEPVASPKRPPKDLRLDAGAGDAKGECGSANESRFRKPYWGQRDTVMRNWSKPGRDGRKRSRKGKKTEARGITAPRGGWRTGTKRTVGLG